MDMSRKKREQEITNGDVIKAIFPNIKGGRGMKLETTNYPCAHCKFGNYMNLDEKWWCSKHNLYNHEMKKNRCLCEKLKTWEFIKEIEDIL